jgi:hypothetical protein
MIQPSTVRESRPKVLAAGVLVVGAVLVGCLFLTSHLAIDVIAVGAFLLAMAAIEISRVRLPLSRVLLPVSLVLSGSGVVADHYLVHDRVATATVDVVVLTVVLMLLAALATRGLNRLVTPHPFSLRPSPCGSQQPKEIQ